MCKIVIICVLLTSNPIIISNQTISLVVELDLKSTSFVPGKKIYERVRWCLKDRLELQFKFLISWVKQGCVYFKDQSAQISNSYCTISFNM